MVLRSLTKQNKVPQAEVTKDSCQFWCRLGVDQDGFIMKYYGEEKGNGVVTTRSFKKGSFLLEYVGEVILCTRVTGDRGNNAKVMRTTNSSFILKKRGFASGTDWPVGSLAWQAFGDQWRRQARQHGTQREILFIHDIRAPYK